MKLYGVQSTEYRVKSVFISNGIEVVIKPVIICNVTEGGITWAIICFDTEGVVKSVMVCNGIGRENSWFGKIDVPVRQNILLPDDTYSETVWRHILFVLEVTDDERQEVGWHGRRDVKAVSDPTISSAHVTGQNYFKIYTNLRSILLVLLKYQKDSYMIFYFINKNND